MKKVMTFTLLGILVLFAAGLLAGLHVFEPWNRILVDKPGDPPPAAGEMSWNTYKKSQTGPGII